VGDNVAIVTTASAIFRRFMVVFLKGQKYQRPKRTLRSGPHPGKREIFVLRGNFLMCETAVTHFMAGKYAMGGVQATRQLLNIQRVNSCKSSRARSSGLCNKT
jgi:hypothetical protein